MKSKKDKKQNTKNADAVSLNIKTLLSPSLLEETRGHKKREKSLEKMRALTKKLLGDGLITNEVAQRYL